MTEVPFARLSNRTATAPYFSLVNLHHKVVPSWVHIGFFIGPELISVAILKYLSGDIL